MNLFGAMRLPRSVLFGSGQRAAIGSIAAQIGTRALVCTDARRRGDAQFRALLADLQRCGVETLVFDRTQPDLPIEYILERLTVAAWFAAQLIIGVRGGS